MPASRLNVSIDRPSANLVSVTKAIVLAGERVMPRSTANSAWCLARAVRSALEAGATPLAQDLLVELLALLHGAEGTYARAIVDHTVALSDRISAQNRIEARATKPEIVSRSA